MINKILFEKSLPFPHISVSLILSCLIISIPLLISDVLYAYLAANVGLVFPWQYLTSVFAHGPEPPLLIHLFINLLIFIFCVATTEKLLGIWRTFLIIVIVATNLSVIRFETLNFYNGISSFIFCFVPFAAFVLTTELKKSGSLSWKEIFNNLLFLTLIIVFIFYPIYFTFTESFLSERNILHFISVIIGLIFFLIWKKRFAKQIAMGKQSDFLKIKVTIADKISRILAYLITVINFLILLVVLIFFD